jgi:DNA-binding PadR family transcriptional regulator
VSKTPERDHHSGTLSPEFALLGFLMAGPSHGYDLHQRFTTELGHVWHLSQSQAYAILDRLEYAGDIHARVVEQVGLPARQVLRLTAQGRRRFTNWLEHGTGNNARAVRLEFLTRLYFGAQYMPEALPHVCAAQDAAINSSIEQLERMLERVPQPQLYNRLSLNLRLRQMRLIQEWIAEVRAQFQIPSDVMS